MPKVTFLVGLCGSGKSYLAPEIPGRLFKEVYGDRNHHVQRDGIFAHPREWEFIRCLQNGGDCVVEEVYYCFPEQRQRVLAMLATLQRVEVEWICFAKDEESAKWNLLYSRDRTNSGTPQDHIAINRNWLMPKYTIPIGWSVRDIIRTEAL